jgi:hypothetical protein
MRDDPNFRMALMTTGLNLLRTPERGQSSFDVFADATTTGVGTLDQLRTRDRAEGREDQKIGLAERRTATTEERTDIARTGVEQRGAAFEASNEMAKARLEEAQRQFDERMKAGDFGPQAGAGAGSTGPERMASLAQAEFIASGMYPDTEQGRSLAGLRAKGLIGKGLITAQDRMDFATDVAKDIAVFNPDMPVAEVLDRAQELADGLANRLNASDPSTIPDDLEGRSFVHPNFGAATVIKVADDLYKIEYQGEGDTPPRNSAIVRGQTIRSELAKYGG